MDIEDQALELRELKKARDEANATFKEMDARYKKEVADFLGLMEEKGIDGIKTDGTNFIPAATVYASISDREEFVKWAEENDDQLIQQKERKELLNELVREKQDNGEPLPPGVSFYVREYISMRAA